MAGDDSSGQGKRGYKISRVDLKPLLESLFTGLFQIVDNTELNENEHVMKCIMRSLARAGEEVIPVTGVFFNKLSSALERVCKNPRNPHYNHYLFESIAALVRNVCSKDASQTSQMEVLLFPPFQTVLQMDITEFTPYVFQVLAQLLEYRPVEAGLGDAYTSLFPPLLTASLWDSKGNVPGLVRLLRAYLKKAATTIIAENFLVQFLGIFQKLNSSKATEESGFALLSAVTMYMPRETLGQHMKRAFTLILTKLQSGKSNRYPGLVIHYFALFTGLFGAQTFFDHMNQIQPGIALTLLVQIWIPKLQMATKNQLGAKIQVVGLTRLLCDTPQLLADDNGKKIWGQALAGVLSVVASPTFGSKDGQDDDDAEIEVGYDSTYTQLHLATSKPEDPFESMGNPMNVFATSVKNLSTSNPGVVSQIVQEAANSDPKLASGLQTIQTKTGINFV